MSPTPFPIGTIIAERRISAYEKSGEKRMIQVRLGASIRADVFTGLPLFRCPLQVLGIGLDEKIYPIAGGDAFEAMQYAIDFAGDLLKEGYARLQLENRTRVDSTTREHWIWRYAPDTETLRT